VKATVNFEFGSEELENLTASLIAKTAIKMVGSPDPTQICGHPCCIPAPPATP